MPRLVKIKLLVALIILICAPSLGCRHDRSSKSIGMLLLLLRGFDLFHLPGTSQILPGQEITRLTVTNPGSIDLTAAPVSFGVPFSESLGINDPQQEVGLFDTSGNPIPVQWTVLTRWGNPTTGALKWAHADFQVSLSPNDSIQVIVSHSTPAIPTMPVSVTEVSGMVSVNTGKIFAQISGRSFNFLNAVSLIDSSGNLVPLLKAGSSTGLSFVQQSGVTATSLDVPDRVIVERSGPIHAVVRVDGRFKQSGGQSSFLYYIARLHFWAGQKYIGVQLTTTDRHDFPRTEGNWDAYWLGQTVQDLKLNLAADVGSSASYWIGEQTLAGGSARLLQDSAYSYTVTREGILLPSAQGKQGGNVEFTGLWRKQEGCQGNMGIMLGSYQLMPITPGATASFVPNLPVAGAYEVYVSWGAYRGACEYLQATNVSYTIQTGSGPSTVTVPIQNDLAGGWRSLGTFSFSSGSTGQVTVSGNNALVDAVRFVYRGTDTARDTTVYVAPPGGAGNNRSPGLAGIHGIRGGVFVVFKDFWQNFPKAFSADSTGSFDIELLPSGPYIFMGGMGKTHEFQLYFEGAGTTPDTVRPELVKLQNYPLPALAPSLYYHQTKVLDLLGYAPSVSDPPEDMMRYDELAAATLNILEQEIELNDAYSWKDFGDYWVGPPYVTATNDIVYSWGNLQHSQTYGALIQYLRTGEARWWQYGQRAFRHSSDIDFIKYSPFRAKYNGTVYRKGECAKSLSHVCSEPIIAMNFMWRQALLHYYMTGDSFSLDLARMSMDNSRLFLHGDGPFTGPFDQNRIDSAATLTRDSAWVVWSLIAGYGELGDPSYLQHARVVTEALKRKQDATGFIGPTDLNSIQDFSPGNAVGYQPQWAGWSLDAYQKAAAVMGDADLRNTVLTAIDHLKRYTLRMQRVPYPVPDWNNWQNTDNVPYLLYTWTYERNPSNSNYALNPFIANVSAVSPGRIYLDVTSSGTRWDSNEIYRGKAIEIQNGPAQGRLFTISGSGVDQNGNYLDIRCDNYWYWWTQSNCYSAEIPDTAGHDFVSLGVRGGNQIKVRQLFEYVDTSATSYNFDVINALTYYSGETGVPEHGQLAATFFRYAQNVACNRPGLMSYPPSQACSMVPGLSSATVGDAMAFPYLFLKRAGGL